MFRPKELYIGLRYTRAKRRNHFVSFIAFISIAGVALGVAALIVVLSVMNGFGKELRARTLSMTAHATISGHDGYMDKWETLAIRAEAHPDVISSAPYIQKEAMLTNGKRVSGSLIRGIIPGQESRVSSVGEKMISGSLNDLKPGEYGIILGKELARSLGAYEGDRVMLITPQSSVTPVGVMPRLRRFRVVGIFEVGMQQFDGAMALIHIEDAGKLFSFGERINGLRLKLKDMFAARHVTWELDRSLGEDYWIRDWTQQHRNFFKALKTEKTVMFIILLMMVAVASLNIVSTLVMTVTDKQSDIAILRTLGMTPGSIMMVFIVQGAIIGLLGTLIGVSIGVPVALNVGDIVSSIEQFFNTQFLPPDVYYISSLTSDLHLSEVLVYSVSAFLLTILATIYPAWRAARTLPAEALRYE